MFCISCADNAKKNSNILEVDIISNLSKLQKVNLSEIASNIEYIVLDTDKKCLVVDYLPIYSTKEYIVAFGGGNLISTEIYVFERRTGKFIRQVSRIGQGPGEYLMPNFLFWDGEKEQISALSNTQNHIFYNIDGTISHEVKYNSNMGKCVAYGDYYAAYSSNRLGDNTIMIAFYNKTGDLIDSIPNNRFWKRTQERESYYSDDNWLYVFDNNLYFKELYCDTFYHIKNFELQPRYIFNTGGLAVPYEIQEGGRWGRGDEDRYEKYVNITKMLEDNRYLYFMVNNKKQLYPAVYDKNKEKVQIMSPVSNFRNIFKITPCGFENDLDGGLPFWPQQMISDKEMMCVYTAEELLKLDISKITDEKLKNVLNHLEEDSNPVVAIVTLKN